jgi:hypothetical protein
MRTILAAFLMVFSLAAYSAGKDESATGSSKPADPAEAPPAAAPSAAWSHLGFHGGWVAQYDAQPLPVAVRLHHRAVAGDRHRKKPARK